MSGDAEFEALGTMFQERNIKDLGGLQKTFVFLDPETRGTPIKLHLTSSAHTLDSAASANRSKYKSLWNYQSGVVAISTPADQSNSKRDSQFLHLICLDLESFVSLFSNVEGLHRMLSLAGKNLIELWNTTYGGIEHRGKRAPISDNYTFAKKQFQGNQRGGYFAGARGEGETSKLILSLDSYTFSQGVQTEDEVEMESLDQVSLHIKLKSTVLSYCRVDQTALDSDGLSFDQWGFCIPLSVFLNFVKSRELAQAVSDARRFLDRQSSIKESSNFKQNAITRSPSFGHGAEEALPTQKEGNEPEPRFVHDDSTVERMGEGEKGGTKRFFIEKEMGEGDQGNARAESTNEGKKKKV